MINAKKRNPPNLPRYKRQNGKGVPMYVLELKPGMYEGVVTDYRLVSTSYGKKLVFDIEITVKSVGEICLEKMLDFTGCIIRGTLTHSFLDELGIISEKYGEIDWNSVQGKPIIATIEEGKTGKPYIKSVMPRDIIQDEIEETEDEEDEEDEDEEE